MSIFNYFKKLGPDQTSQVLNKSSTSLSSRETEEVRKKLIEKESEGGKRKKYRIWTGEERAEIGRLAHKHGNAIALNMLIGRYPRLTKQTLSDFKKAYLALKSNEDEVLVIKKKKIGRPTLLPEELMKKTIETVNTLRLKGAPVSASVINSVAKGIILANDSSLLTENGGPISLSNYWARNILYRMDKEGRKMTRRMATTSKIPVSPGLLKETKLDFQRKIKGIQSRHSIPDELILNFDQTPLSYVCTSNHTLHEKAASSVPLLGKGKQKQITGTFTVSKSGVFLPMQLIYEGKTNRCLPQGIKFPDGFDVTHIPNHWSNEEKVTQLLNSVIFPFMPKQREELQLPVEQKAMLIFNVFKGQTTNAVLKLIEDNNCIGVFVPANLTHYFQPLDLTVNGPAKKFLKSKFEEWYARNIEAQLNSGIDVYSVEVSRKLSTIKPLHAHWLIGLYDHMRNNPEMIKKGFELAGINDALTTELEPEDPFEDLD